MSKLNYLTNQTYQRKDYAKIRKYTNLCRLDQTLVNDESITKEIKKKVFKFLESNK